MSVREEGLEPSHPEGHRHLKPARLPIPPLARVLLEGIVSTLDLRKSATCSLMVVSCFMLFQVHVQLLAR